MLEALKRKEQCGLPRRPATPGALSWQAGEVVSAQGSAELSLAEVRFQPSLVLLMAAGASLTADMHRALASSDPGLPFSDLDRLQEFLSRALTIEGAALVTVAAIAILALALCAVGLFALVGTIAARRPHGPRNGLSTRNADSAVLRFSEDMTGSLGKLDKLFVNQGKSATHRNCVREVNDHVSIAREAAFLKQTPGYWT
jgi:hypothetical protein